MAEGLLGEGVFLAGTEAGVEGRSQNLGRHGLLDGRLDGPPPFARVGHRPGELRERGSPARAIAVRSKSHEPMTLPRRQTSAMSARFSR